MPLTGVSLALVVLVLDQLTKALILGATGLPVAVTPFFNIVLVWNRGISFGLLDSNSSLAPWLLTALALAVVVLLGTWLYRTRTLLVAAGLGLVIGGALGNVIDRLRFGAVVDFLDFHAAGWHWPAFNVADSAICVGAALLLFDGLFRRDDHST